MSFQIHKTGFSLHKMSVGWGEGEGEGGGLPVSSDRGGWRSAPPAEGGGGGGGGRSAAAAAARGGDQQRQRGEVWSGIFST